MHYFILAVNLARHGRRIWNSLHTANPEAKFFKSSLILPRKNSELFRCSQKLCLLSQFDLDVFGFVSAFVCELFP